MQNHPRLTNTTLETVERTGECSKYIGSRDALDRKCNMTMVPVKVLRISVRAEVEVTEQEGCI